MEEKIVTIIALLVGLKLLFIFCYYSTDFEVHRNWLAITYSLPYEKWYYENTSIWTLDYPPYFAWFEYCLGKIGFQIDPDMIKISETAYANQKIIIFQRITVIAADLFYMYASLRCVRILTPYFTPIDNRRPKMYFVVATLLITNGGLLLVDSIHFQYNGMLFGIFLLSISAIFEQRYFLSAVLFATLLNFKHIFAYVAPAYVIFLLRNYCFTSNYSFKSLSLQNCFKLASALLTTFGLSFGPFLLYDVRQITQILSRLFPFKRGLTHAYWAPNFWALYNFVDLCLNNVIRKFYGGHVISPEYTSGMVQEFQHTVLPNVTPLTCLILTLTFILPFCILALFTKSKFECFLKLINLCAFASYMFGWHVHEKAILMCILPLNLLCFQYKYAKIYLLSIVVGIFSLFPLFFTEFESILKYCIWLLYCLFGVYGLKCAHKYKDSSAAGYSTIPFFNFLETLYIFGFVPLEFYCSFLHWLLKFDTKFKFLPLLLTSVYCSVGILYVWFLSCWQFLCDELSIDTKLYRFIWKRYQIRLSGLLKCTDTEMWQSDFETKLKLIAGLDISTVVGDEHNAIVCLVILRYPSLEVAHVDWEHITINVPYIPSFLAFREAPPLINIVQKLIQHYPEFTPQVILIDGNGYLHPRKFGLACHVGLSLDICTVGVAKKITSNVSHKTIEKLKEFSTSEDIQDIHDLPLIDDTGEILGYALKPNKTCKNPIFVSIGHKISIKTAVRLVKADIISRQIVQEILA